MLTDQQNKALFYIANRVLKNSEFPLKWKHQDGNWYGHDLDGYTNCRICWKRITCNCKGHPDDGKDHALQDLLDEHGLVHLKEYKLLPFI